MKENVLDVLVYLFENLIDDSAEARDRDSLQAELIEAGFAPTEITKAFDWMEELSQRRAEVMRTDGAAAPGEPERFAPVAADSRFRVYASEEIDRLDAECRGFLMFLEQQRILDPVRREIVLDRLMALELDDVDLIDLKWVVLMVLFNVPGQEAAYAWMESHMLEGGGERVH